MHLKDGAKQSSAALISEWLPEKNLKKPEWLKARLPSGEKYYKIKNLVRKLKLSTVCEEARCPNMGECWDGGTATLMLMGDICSRGCRFCHVKTGNPKGRLDPLEPEKTAFIIRALKLSYIVLTSVDRDDLPDQGAGHIAKTIALVKKQSPSVFVEILSPDFQGDVQAIDTVCRTAPHVFAHNVETVERLSRIVRDPRAGHQQSLEALSYVKKHYPHIYTKTSLMLGLGETDEEVFQTLKRLREAGCDAVTFGQYLRPSRRHLPVQDYVTPQKFDAWAKRAKDLGFLYTASGPLVRSSYKAGEFFLESVLKAQTNRSQLV